MPSVRGAPRQGNIGGEWRRSLPYLVLFTLAIGTGLVLGGSLREFESLRIHRWGLALIAAALQAPAAGDRGRARPR